MAGAASARVLLTGYFFRNRDPQRRTRYRANDDRLLACWLPGVRRLGLCARIFHDGLSEVFVRRHQTRRIRFVRASIPRGVSCNDQRFVLYRRWLAANPDIESVFCTDLFDVHVKRDPHDLSAAYPQLWVGREPWLIGDRPSMRARLLRAYGEVDPELIARPVLNAGIFGGPRSLVASFLDDMCRELSALRRHGTAAFNCNMAAFNTVLYRSGWQGHAIAPGRPLHTVFGWHESGAQDACFVHR